ncbi:MAG TPA: hypothetical protein DEU64_06660 [Dehalococcoidia bacterium]|nr:hypothetical protein [Dehalococcoidia bacterium]
MKENPKGIPKYWPIKKIHYGWAIVVASFLSTFAEVPGFGPVLGVFIKPIQDELGWSRATISTGFLIGSVTGALASSVTGRLIDRYGPRVIVSIAGLVIAIALIGLSLMQEIWQFWAFFGLARGSAIAGVEIGTSVAVAQWFIRQRGRALALKSVGQRSGQAVIPIVIFLIMAWSDWRTAYLALSAFAVISITIPAYALLRSKPEKYGLQPDGVELQSAKSESGTHEIEESWTLAEARKTKAFWMITIFLMCTPFVQGATNLHMVANFQDKGLPDIQAVSIASIFAATSALSIVPIGFVLEKVHVRIGAIVQAVLVLISMLLLLVADSYPTAILWALIFGVGAGMRNVVEVLLVANYFGRESLGTIKGFTAPFRAVSPIGPVLAGFIRDKTGSYDLAFIIFASVAILMLVLMLGAKQPSKK